MRALDGGATISRCGRYRRSLWRKLGLGMRRCVFVGLNPSTADGRIDDPIRREMAFAVAWGCDWLDKVNLYDWRSTDPDELWKTGCPCSDTNLFSITAAAENADVFVVAWGAYRGPGIDERIRDLYLALGDVLHVPIMCLGTTKNGAPRHPLFVKQTTPLQRWVRP